MAAAEAVRYREKAKQLREAAASAPNNLLRGQLASLASQYEQLAASVESMREPNRPVVLAQALNP
jgi:hypothetical protein